MREKKIPCNDIPTDKNFDILFDNAQDVSHRISRTVPLPGDLKVGELVLVYNGQIVQLYTQIIKNQVPTIIQVTLT
jgi:hypothetical protein